MPLPAQFATVSEATGAQLDADLAALGALTPIPCTIAGTNLLSLTSVTLNVPTVPSYANNQTFVGISSSANTGATQAQVNALPLVSVYKDTPAGPVQLVGGEIQPNNLIALTYDKTLNSGAGGFHLASGILLPTTTPNQTKRRELTTTAALTFSAINPGAINEQTIALTGCSIGDIIGLGFPSSIASGVVFQGYVSIAGVVLIRAQNVTGASTITPPSGTYRALATGF